SPRFSRRKRRPPHAGARPENAPCDLSLRSGYRRAAPGQRDAGARLVLGRGLHKHRLARYHGERRAERAASRRYCAAAARIRVRTPDFALFVGPPGRLKQAVMTKRSTYPPPSAGVRITSESAL